MLAEELRSKGWKERPGAGGADGRTSLLLNHRCRIWRVKAGSRGEAHSITFFWILVVRDDVVDFPRSSWAARQHASQSLPLHFSPFLSYTHSNRQNYSSHFPNATNHPRPSTSPLFLASNAPLRPHPASGTVTATRHVLLQNPPATTQSRHASALRQSEAPTG